jgi:hypothetical protein
LESHCKFKHRRLSKFSNDCMTIKKAACSAAFQLFHFV